MVVLGVELRALEMILLAQKLHWTQFLVVVILCPLRSRYWELNSGKVDVVSVSTLI
jgi:hypothetical protein